MIKELLLIACIDTNHIADSGKMVHQDSVIKFQNEIITSRGYEIERHKAVKNALQAEYNRQDSIKQELYIRLAADADKRRAEEFKPMITFGMVAAFVISIFTTITFIRQ